MTAPMPAPPDRAHTEHPGSVPIEPRRKLKKRNGAGASKPSADRTEQQAATRFERGKRLESQGNPRDKKPGNLAGLLDHLYNIGCSVRSASSAQAETDSAG